MVRARVEKRMIQKQKFRNRPDVEFDDEAPCAVCGEPVTAVSTSGPDICPWCAMGKCRFCKIPIFVMRESIDSGRSKKKLLEHMKWHKEKEPDFNKNVLENRREIRKLMNEE